MSNNRRSLVRLDNVLRRPGRCKADARSVELSAAPGAKGTSPRSNRNSVVRQTVAAFRGLLIVAAGTLPFSLGRTAAAEEPSSIRFNRDVRGILSDKCFACHGPDKNKREADLRLDTEAGLFGEGDEAGVVARGKPAESELWRRIVSEDPEQRMPPAGGDKGLSAEEIETLRRWIEQGADWQGHWSLQPIARPEPPAVNADGADAPSDGAMMNPIDAFVRRRLAEQGLAPSAEADRITLIRRLRFDLTGLPPTPAEVDQFLADKEDGAYERLVDRLLASEHYGERMAMWWLDLVRYADSVGYHGDQPVSVSPFRDYVIRSFNENKPFDRFTLEQLAGDLLPDATLEHRIASGYNRLGMMSAEGGVQPREYLAKYIAERVRNLGGAWLGMTTGCCECHDHKYDPLTMKDFYSMQAFFADIQERGLYGGADFGSNVKVPTPDQAERLADLDKQLAEIRTTLDTTTPEIAAAQAEWEKSQVVWTPLEPQTITSNGGATLTKKDDQSILASGAAPDTDTYTITIANPPAGISAIRLEVLPDDSLPKKGPGRAGNGNFVLTELVARFKPASASEPSESEPATPENADEANAAEQPVKFTRAAASFEQAAAGDKTPYGKWTAAGAIDDEAKGATFGWAVLEQIGKPNFAVFETELNIAGGEGSTLTIELRQNHDNAGHTLGRFRLLATSAERPVGLSELLPPEIAAILAAPAADRDEAALAKLASHYRSIAPLLDATRAKQKELEAARTQVDNSIVTSLVTVAVQPRTIRVLPRGNWMDDSGEVVEPAFPAVLPQAANAAEGKRLTREDLAHWLTSRENPLTARVFANRVWKLHFGAGLSRKLDDVGAQGDWPTHPELLDYLAGRFIDSGWDVKGLVRLIVTSRTYRQSSVETPELRDRDPLNLWLARQSHFRLDAEMVRDNALRVSGLLVERVGGRSVNPYQPPGYWAYLNFPQREWQNGTGDQLYRRGLYTHWQRQYLHPSLLAFDAPSREECAADRPRSNTPLQSLVLLNDPSYVEAARSFAEQVLRDGGENDEARLTWAFRRALSRTPEPREAELMLKLVASHREQYAADEGAAAELLKVGARPAPSDLPAADLAAWTSATRAILCLHETITRN